MSARYEIETRPVELGGGWRLRLFEGGEEVGGGVFPAPEGEGASQEAHIDAVNEGESWLLRFAAPIEGITQ
jgi:hypothetical protein